MMINYLREQIKNYEIEHVTFGAKKTYNIRLLEIDVKLAKFYPFCHSNGTMTIEKNEIIHFQIKELFLERKKL